MPLLALLPAGKAGLAVKIVMGLIGAAWWTSAPGADEERYVPAFAHLLSGTRLECTDPASLHSHGNCHSLPELISSFEMGSVLCCSHQIFWWCSNFKAQAEKRRAYNRHYALKGRGRKESFRQSVKLDRAEVAPTRAFCEQS